MMSIPYDKKTEFRELLDKHLRRAEDLAKMPSMESSSLFDYTKRILQNGPDRVLVSQLTPGYNTVNLSMAEKQFGITPSIIFIRSDGWSLGAPKHLEETAYNMWRASWSYFVRQEDQIFKPMSEYLLQKFFNDETR